MLAPMNKAQAEGAPSAEDLAALECEASTCGSAVKEAKQRTKQSGSEEDRHKVGNAGLCWLGTPCNQMAHCIWQWHQWVVCMGKGYAVHQDSGSWKDRHE